MSYQKIVGALCAADTKQVGNQYVGQDKLIVEPISHGRQSVNSFGGGVASTLMERQYKSGDDLVVEEPVVYPGVGITSKENANNPHPGNHAPSLTTDSRNYMVDKKRKYIVRRLTPTECARLQGFPDWWTDGADGSDSAKYKLWGNGIALPCAEDVIGRIARAYERGL